MTQTDEYILNAIRKKVWSGFYNHDDVQQLIDDILEDDADEEMLRSAVAPEFERKAAAELGWPKVTDCDRLDDAFHVLNETGIIALENAGYEMSDGLTEVAEELQGRGRASVRGYCFYHGQDVEGALAGGGLYIAFGALDAETSQKTAIGREVKQVLEAKGLAVEWNGDPEMRLKIPQIDWKRRSR